MRGLDVETGLSMGMLLPGTARDAMFTEGALAASWQAQDLGVGPYPVAFLAECVRVLGVEAALQLPEPLIGQEPTALARRWLSAASGPSRNITRDDLFARWLDTVATRLRAHRRAHRPDNSA